MKNTYSRMLGLLVVLICFVSLAMPIYASNDSDILMQRGYPEEYVSGLNHMQTESLEAIAGENDLVYLGMKTVPDENQGVDMTLLYSGVLWEEDGTSYIERVFVTVDYRWRAIPAERNRDMLTLRFETSDFNVGSYFTSTDYMQRAKDGEWVSGKTTDEPHLRNERDITYHVNIKFNGVKAEKMAALHGTASFDLIPTVPMKYDPDGAFPLDMKAYYSHIIPENGILQSQGVLEAGKWLLLVIAIFAVYAVIALVWEKIWASESKAVRISALTFVVIVMVCVIFRFGIVGLVWSAAAAFFLYQELKN